MGYPEGTKGYHLRNKDSGTFFIAHDIILDENLPSLTHITDSDSDNDTTPASAPTVPTAMSPAPVPTAPVPTPALPSSTPAPPCQSSRQQGQTAGGQAFAEEIAASKARLQALHDACLE